MSLQTFEVQCPYCGEAIEVDVELMDTDQVFIEDCTVCCRPIQYRVMPGDPEPEIAAERTE